MDLDAMAIHVRTLKEFRDKWEPSATETLEAGVYFGGFTNATQVPGALLFAQYPQNAVSLAKQKAAHAERPERLMGKPKSSDDDPRGDAIETGGTGVDGPPGE